MLKQPLVTEVVGQAMQLAKVTQIRLDKMGDTRIEASLTGGRESPGIDDSGSFSIDLKLL